MLAQYGQLLLYLAVSSVYGQTRQSIVPGLAFRFTSPSLLTNAGLACSDDGNNMPRFTAGVEIRSNYTEACYNLADIFAWRDANHTAGRIDRSCHWDSDSCPNEWRYLDHSNFAPDATHSIITTHLAGDRMSEWLDGTAQVFRTFQREDCDEEGDWHQWMGCEDETDECRELPYGVRSFRVGYQAEEEDRVDECVFARERGVLESGCKVMDANVMILLAMAAGVTVFVQ